jgi:hypothetical protein
MASQRSGRDRTGHHPSNFVFLQRRGKEAIALHERNQKKGATGCSGEIEERAALLSDECPSNSFTGPWCQSCSYAAESMKKEEPSEASMDHE